MTAHRCELCGSPVKVHSSSEGTSFYEPTDTLTGLAGLLRRGQVPGPWSEERVRAFEKECSEFIGQHGDELLALSAELERSREREAQLRGALESGENYWSFLFNLSPGVELDDEVRRALARANLDVIRAALRATGEPS